MSQFKHLRGKVIMFDGPDYVGKSTQLKLVQSTLAGDGLKVYSTRYNGGTPIGEALRNAMFGSYDRPAISELYINLAQQHALDAVLKTERTAGSVVLVDRSPLSIIAYQVYGGGLAKAKGYEAADEVIALHKPDLIICYQTSEKILTARRRKGGHSTDYFELKPAAYFKKVADGYQAAIKRYRPKVVEASGTIAEVHDATMQALAELA